MTGEIRPKHSDRQREILSVAMECFLHGGYAGTSMNAVARAAGIRKASLYHHFPSKEALFVAAMTTDLAQCATRLTNLLHDSALNHEARLRQAMGIIYTAIVDSPAGRMAPVVAETARTVPAVAQGFYEAFVEQMADAFMSIIAAGAADDVFRPLDRLDLYHLVFGPPVHLAVSRAMFSNLQNIELSHLEMVPARESHTEGLLRMLAFTPKAERT